MVRRLRALLTAAIRLRHVEAQIRDAGHYGVHAISRDPAARDDFAKFDRAIIEHPRGLSFRMRLDEVIRLAPTLRQHVPAGSMEERMLAEVEQTTNDGPVLAARLGASRTRFPRLLARAKRQRNAVAHGTRAVSGGSRPSSRCWTTSPGG